MEKWSIVATAVVAVVAIAATFFAPSWSERTIERRREARDFRVAKRLVALELRRLTVDLTALHGAPQAIDPSSVGFLEVPEWDAHKAMLARSLPDDVWVSVRDTYTSVEKTRHAYTIAHGLELDDDRKQVLADILLLANRSLALLEAT